MGGGRKSPRRLDVMAGGQVGGIPTIDCPPSGRLPARPVDKHPVERTGVLALWHEELVLMSTAGEVIAVASEAEERDGVLACVLDGYRYAAKLQQRGEEWQILFED